MKQSTATVFFGLSCFGMAILIHSSEANLALLLYGLVPLFFLCVMVFGPKKIHKVEFGEVYQFHGINVFGNLRLRLLESDEDSRKGEIGKVITVDLRLKPQIYRARGIKISPDLRLYNYCNVEKQEGLKTLVRYRTYS